MVHMRINTTVLRNCNIEGVAVGLVLCGTGAVLYFKFRFSSGVMAGIFKENVGKCSLFGNKNGNGLKSELQDIRWGRFR